LGILLLLGSLGVLKYLGFALGSVRALRDWFGWGYTVPSWRVLLPVGISFYTFQALGYLIDVYRGNTEPERHLGILALFMSFFPQLILGPIERAGSLTSQLKACRDTRGGDISGGAQRVLWGMFKKVVVADRMSVYVDAVYNHPGDHRGLPVLLATVFFAVQIYCDFSGYTDIALGSARMLGYYLTPNFRQPYFSRSIVEFWRRWHVTLSNWFRDYLYIPLGGNRVPRWRWCANVVIVFAVSGLWHGASWTFVLWGGLHGAFYLLDAWTVQARSKVIDKLAPKRGLLWGGMSTLFTLVLVCAAWLFFRANSIRDAFMLLGNAVRLGASTDLYTPWSGLGDNPVQRMALAIGLIALWAAVESVTEFRWKPVLALWQRDWVRWGAFLLLALVIMNLGVAQETAFVYLEF
jgi:D-alanyl-lipoteichoic acid acyltransferase DltB (MBOAT superfamily)